MVRGGRFRAGRGTRWALRGGACAAGHAPSRRLPCLAPPLLASPLIASPHLLVAQTLHVRFGYASRDRLTYPSTSYETTVGQLRDKVAHDVGLSVTQAGSQLLHVRYMTVT